MEIKKVGIVGCGAMGSGIVTVCAQAGLPVVVSEISQDYLDKGLSSIDKFLTGSVQKGRLSAEEKTATLARIKGTTDFNDFADRDLVIEAVPEKLELKKKVFSDLDRICKPEALIASNTSAMSIMTLAVCTKRVDQVLGLHFFNPAPIMKLLEVIRTIATSDEAIDAGRAFGSAVGKSVVVTKDAPGFIVNALSIPYTLNAIRLLESGRATKEDIDAAARIGLNYPMGPLELADFLGIDSLYGAAVDMYERTKDPQYAPPLLLQEMISAGWIGRRAGRGFYVHNKS